MNRRAFMRAGGGLAMLAAVPGQLVDPEAAKQEKERRGLPPKLAPRFQDGRRHFPLCLYYSIADWHHPNYPNQGRHHELPPQPGDQPDLAKYTQYVKAQIRELCTNYGEIHGIWWDMNVDKLVDPSISAVMVVKLEFENDSWA